MSCSQIEDQNISKGLARLHGMKKHRPLPIAQAEVLTEEVRPACGAPKGNVVDAHDPWQDWFNTNFSSDLVDANTSTSIDLCFDGLLAQGTTDSQCQPQWPWYEGDEPGLTRSGLSGLTVPPVASDAPKRQTRARNKTSKTETKRASKKAKNH